MQVAGNVAATPPSRFSAHDECDVVVDGSYTNSKVLRKKSRETVVIGRIRKDAHLNAKPDNQKLRGRKRIYGEDLSTPEQVRKDRNILWQEIEATVGGKRRELRVKTLSPVRWQSADQMEKPQKEKARFHAGSSERTAPRTLVGIDQPEAFNRLHEPERHRHEVG